MFCLALLNLQPEFHCILFTFVFLLVPVLLFEHRRFFSELKANRDHLLLRLQALDCLNMVLSVLIVDLEKFAMDINLSIEFFVDLLCGVHYQFLILNYYLIQKSELEI